eukprot:GHUV01038692.1.p1 GENE.GHUV01038692.1~~GHUV01038692.1.p1  ORF type:complete len:162 (-),score=31.95 GHUV01038692.1:60-545(-)
MLLFLLLVSCCDLLQQFADFGRGVMDFALLGIPAAIVNSGLKFMQKNLELSFQQRLTLYLHRLYTSNRAYYAASTLGGLTHADQRITEDVEKFCFSVSDLYSHTFKVRHSGDERIGATGRSSPPVVYCVSAAGNCLGTSLCHGSWQLLSGSRACAADSVMT